MPATPPVARDTLTVARAEWRMQLRRPAVWLVLTLACGFVTYRMVSLGPIGPRSGGAGLDWATALRGAANRAVLLNMLLPPAFGLLLADRLPRDTRLRTAETLDALPPTVGVRLWGKLLGAGGATGLLVFGYSLLASGYAAVVGGNALPLLAGLLTFASVTVPALAFTGALAVAGTLLVPLPLYLALFTGYWFWGNILPPSVVPSLSCSWLSPAGGNVSAGLFGGTALYAGTCRQPPAVPAAVDALGSLLLVALVIAAAMLAGSAVATRRQRAS